MTPPPLAVPTALLWTDAAALTADARPQLVLIADLARADVVRREAALFGSGRMQLAARVFRHVHLAPADAAKDPRLAGFAADAPVLLVATPDGTKAFSLRGADLTADGALEKMTAVTASVSTDDLSTIVANAERTQTSIAAVDAELAALARTPLSEADRQARTAAATARRNALVTEFRAQFVLHARTTAGS